MFHLLFSISHKGLSEQKGVQDRKRLKVEITKPVEPKTEGPATAENAAKPDSAAAEGSIMGEAAPGDETAGDTNVVKAENHQTSAAVGDQEPNQGQVDAGAGNDDAEVSTESDENRPGRDIQQAESAEAPEQKAEQASAAEPSPRDGQDGAKAEVEASTVAAQAEPSADRAQVAPAVL